MKEYKYVFSVVMAVYNVESYIREAVESLIDQSIGFSCIQLILVDDGSTDGSGKICDEYRKKYSQNVIVIHKKNGGVASARNAGLIHAEGHYLNFMDSDDIFSRDAFKSVYEFFGEHESEIDVCTVPIYFFDGASGSHWQNGKFNRGSRIINLMEEYDAPLMFVNASFFRNPLKKDIVFDSRLVCGEDIKVIAGILIKKKTLGVVASGKYLYRRRKGESTSLIQTSKKKAGWYDDYFTCLIDWCIEKYISEMGFLPGFIQYLLLSDLQWRFRGDYEKDMLETLCHDPERIKTYKNRLNGYMKYFQDKYIMEMKMIYPESKLYMLKQKHGTEASVMLTGSDAVLCYKETVISKVSDMRVVWEFLSLDKEKNECIFEGYYILYGLQKESVRPYVSVNGRDYPCSEVKRQKKDTVLFGCHITNVLGFKAVFPLKGNTVIRSFLLVNGRKIYCRNYGVGSFFPVTRTYKNAYAIINKNIVTVLDNALHVKKISSNTRLFIKECCLLSEIWKKNDIGGRKAIPGRLLYHVLSPLKRRQLWIISDRIMKADDNGEALFRYIVRNKPANVDAIFAISKKSSDYRRLSKIGKCVDAMSYRHKLLHLFCDINISSQADMQTDNPFRGHDSALRDLLIHQKFVFLQHGITKDDISDWLNRYEKNIEGIVTAAEQEYQSFRQEDYSYSDHKLWLTGFPRYDRLYNDKKKRVTIMPTWRSYLVGQNNEKTGIRAQKKEFINSDYYHFYNSLINSERLLEKLEQHGYRLQFLLHPILQIYTDKFHKDHRVEFLKPKSAYRDIFAHSDLLITDYSSTAFDFAYLRKPIVYCQFDQKSFFSGMHTYTKGYFDYTENGFGEIACDLDQTIDLISDYIETGCMLKNKYRKRIDNFFAFSDRNNCKRVLEKLIALSEENSW